ncbi:hypothetical protein ABFS82_13G191700 [Erythranthe guttata]
MRVFPFSSSINMSLLFSDPIIASVIELVLYNCSLLYIMSASLLIGLLCLIEYASNFIALSLYFFHHSLKRLALWFLLRNNNFVMHCAFMLELVVSDSVLFNNHQVYS